MAQPWRSWRSYGNGYAVRASPNAVMESTGSYWKPVFNVLEDAVKVYLANPQEVKNRRGHKTDDKDGWWLAHLLRHAMIHPSFIPPRVIRELRDLTRRRRRLLGNVTAEKNRIQKVLEDETCGGATSHRSSAPVGGGCFRLEFVTFWTHSGTHQ